MPKPSTPTPRLVRRSLAVTLDLPDAEPTPANLPPLTRDQSIALLLCLDLWCPAWRGPDAAAQTRAANVGRAS